MVGTGFAECDKQIIYILETLGPEVFCPEGLWSTAPFPLSFFVSSHPDSSHTSGCEAAFPKLPSLLLWLLMMFTSSNLVPLFLPFLHLPAHIIQANNCDCLVIVYSTWKQLFFNPISPWTVELSLLKPLTCHCLHFISKHSFLKLITIRFWLFMQRFWRWPWPRNNQIQ